MAWAPLALLLVTAATVTTAATAATAATAGNRHSTNIAEDARLNVPALVRKYGYPLEEHTVVTSDGYVLTAHRIPHARGERPVLPGAGARTPVLVMHGLMCSSADFLVLGPGSALGYLLADAGYDVWLANARGNYYSRRHLSLDPDERERLDFWRFSWDEIGERDLPALVEHVSAISGRRRMHYVGYSQGTTAFLVMAALRPEYGARFLSFQALAPAAFNEYSDNPARDELMQYESLLDAIAFSNGFGEVLRRRPLFADLGLQHCADGAELQELCAQALTGGSQHVNRTLLPVFAGHNPAGAALRQIIHYAQVQRFGRFARYNFDPVTNMARYGSLRPPEYDVTRVTTPTHLHYGLGDANSLPANVRLLARRMGARAVLHAVPRASFNHFDFIWASDARAQLYEPVLALLRRHDE
ncbi:lipase 1-like [Bicyclus anynana]|uniref:Lipase n=1 Tax=Bicyclus anynana TaxID=110368 RepID=A0A6J1P5L2_BICAN|nr:lipase 1-like [Bicyclus anynana]